MKALQLDKVKLEELKPGDVFNSYPELCNGLGIEACGGNQKKKQLKELERFMDYEKNGKQFIINEVYKEPLDEEFRIAANAKYTGLIQNILLSYLAQQKDEVAYITQYNLWDILGMVNDRYMKMRGKENREQLLTLMDGMTLFDVNDFFKRSNTKFRDIVKVSLNSLKRRKLLLFEEVYRVGVPIYNSKNEYRGFEYRDATDAEKRYILKTEHNLLQEFGFETDFQMFCSDRREEYYDRLGEIFQEEKDWRNIYFCYKFIYDKENIINTIEGNDAVMKMNQLMVEALDAQADHNYEKRGEANMEPPQGIIKKKVFRYYDGYPERQRVLSDNLIKR